jgi:hypothetical protein
MDAVSSNLTWEGGQGQWTRSMEATASPSKEGSPMGVGKGEGRFEGENLTDAGSSSVIFEKGYFNRLLGRQHHILKRGLR